MHIKVCVLIALTDVISSMYASSLEGADGSSMKVIQNPKFSYELKLEEGNSNDPWKFGYFPSSPYEEEVYPQILSRYSQQYANLTSCDDGKSHLDMDWDGSFDSYTCFEDYFGQDSSVHPVIHQDIIPPEYKAPRFCMAAPLEYNDQPILTFGSHRPVPPAAGEYRFLPMARALSGLENGFVEMLYHPCADPTAVNQLRQLVITCLNSYLITPRKELPVNTPIALVTWGWYLAMNTVNEQIVIEFIKAHAFQGPEKEPVGGDFKDGLLIPAAPANNAPVCPDL